jgi:hypothetical protein
MSETSTDLCISDVNDVSDGLHILVYLGQFTYKRPTETTTTKVLLRPPASFSRVGASACPSRIQDLDVSQSIYLNGATYESIPLRTGF